MEATDKSFSVSNLPLGACPEEARWLQVEKKDNITRWKRMTLMTKHPDGIVFALP